MSGETAAVPQPNFTKSISPAVLSTWSRNAPVGSPLSMTMVMPRARGFSGREGRSSAVRTIGTIGVIGHLPGRWCDEARKRRIAAGRPGAHAPDHVEDTARPHRRQQAGCNRGPVARGTDDGHRLVVGDLVDAARQLRAGDEGGPVDMARSPLGGLADVEDVDRHGVHPARKLVDVDLRKRVDLAGCGPPGGHAAGQPTLRDVVAHPKELPRDLPELP